MADGWLVLELTPKGEKENPYLVERELCKHLPGVTVYIPAIETQVGDDQVVHYLMKGYAFVQNGPTLTPKKLKKLEGTRYIQSVLTSGSTLVPVEDSYIEEMKEKIRAEVNQGIGIGDTVEICSGPYKHIEASVIVELPETKEVQVFVQLRSKQALLTLPRSVLKVVDRAPLSPYFARLGYLRAWAGMAKVLLSYNPPHRRLQDTYLMYDQITSWMAKGSKLFSFVHSERLEGGIQRLRASVELVEALERWRADANRIYQFLYFDDLMPRERVSSLSEKYIQLAWLSDVENRVLDISHEVEGVARDLAAQSREGDDSMTVQNVLVDGHNLAHRCYHAPGIGNLKSRSGAPTGVIVGFLRSLGALKKRFPEAKFWVAWDGSSQRRKQLYGEYKAGRTTATFPDQEKFLEDILPTLGVRQVFNSEEEADDVLATLVRGPLAEDRNLIFSTDKDFLQVVTDTTMLLTPAIGSRKEILYNPERVKEVFGLPPDGVVQLRAFYGDQSDNLPGVPRVPKKTLKSLVVAHKTVQGVYSSGLASLSRGQYERLRTAESQVRLNLEAMSLVDVELTHIYPDVDADEASRRLGGIDVDPSPILKAFFGNPPQATKC